LHCIVISAAHHHRGALVRQFQSDGSSAATTASRDDGNLALESQIHPSEPAELVFMYLNAIHIVNRRSPIVNGRKNERASPRTIRRSSLAP
jgi:hypothetical protein